jgi:hypothetical protein
MASVAMRGQFQPSLNWPSDCWRPRPMGNTAKTLVPRAAPPMRQSSRPWTDLAPRGTIPPSEEEGS